jgi:hypothetical protein
VVHAIYATRGAQGPRFANQNTLLIETVKDCDENCCEAMMFAVPTLVTGPFVLV